MNNKKSPHYLLVGYSGHKYHIQYALDNKIPISLVIRKEKYKEEYEDIFENVYAAENIFDFTEIKSLIADTKATAVFTRFEAYLSVVGVINEILGLDGIDYKVARNFGNKYLMKKRWLDAGVPCANGVCADNPENIDKFLETHDFPLILKKTSGVHSSFVFKVKSREELQEKIDFIYENAGEYKASRPIVNYNKAGLENECDLLLEELLSGIEISMDTFIIDGIFTHTPICQYIMPEELDVDDSYLPAQYMPTELSQEQQTKVNAVAEEVISALGASNCVCHTEFFYDLEKDKAWVIETTARGGGYRAKMINDTTSGNEYNGSVFKAVNGEKIDEFVSNGKSYTVIEYFSDKKGIIKSMDLDFLNDIEGVEIVKIKSKVGDEVNLARDGGKMD